MPLLDLKTDLKSLKYGQDRPDGGSSDQPYIKVDINNVDRGFNQFRLTKFDDGLIRGGIIGAANASVVDTLRIGKFFTDFPKGYLFIAKQVGLQLSNPRLEVPKNPLNIAAGGLNNLLSAGTGGLLQPTRIYNLGINTIAQVPVNAFGVHFNRHGILPVQGEESKYEAIVKANNDSKFNNPSQNNRLITLANKFKLGDSEFDVTLNLAAEKERIRLANRANRNITKNINFSNKAAYQNALANYGTVLSNFLLFPTSAPALSPTLQQAPFPSVPSPPPPFVPQKFIKQKLNINTDSLFINQYLGGPDSVYGIGTTTLKRYSFTEDKEKNLQSLEQSYNNAGKPLIDGTRQTFDYIDPATSSSLVSRDLGKGNNAISNYFSGSTSTVTDISEIIKGISIPNSSYPALAQIVNASVTTDQFNYYATNRTAGNAVNNSSGAYSVTPFVSGALTYQNTYGDIVTISGKDWSKLSRENRIGSGRKDELNLGNTTKDLISFKIDPVGGTSMVFRAYLTDLSDSVDAEWSDIKYAGRGDKFFVYNGFTRKISIGFKTAALSAGEMTHIYKRLNYLMSNLMPDYNGVLMRGPLVNLTVGNWITDQRGVLNLLSYKIPQESPWEINLAQTGSYNAELPHVVEVNLTFTPIGSHGNIPQKSNSIKNINYK